MTHGRGLWLLVALLWSASARANAPAPWAVCAGKQPGATCSSLYYPLGRCVLHDSGCENGQASCLYCEGHDSATGIATMAIVIGALALAGFGVIALLRRKRT